MSLTVNEIRTRRGGFISLTEIGFGAAPLGNMHRVLMDDQAAATLDAAWSTGLRYFDTAPLYGHGLSEQRLGAFFQGIPRDTFVISTKVGRLLEPCQPGEENSGIYVNTPNVRVHFDYTYDGIMRSFESSIARLGLSYIDILYVHDIDAFTHGPEGADARIRELMDQGGWRALDSLRSAGVVSAIGVGVNACEPCERLLELADPDIFLLAGRYTLLDQSALISLFPKCQTRGVAVVIGGPYNSGILATGAVSGAYYNYAPASPEILARVRELEAICHGHGVKLADAALHFPLSHPIVKSVIPGCQTAAEVSLNIKSYGTAPAGALWAELAAAGLIPERTALPGEETVHVDGLSPASMRRSAV